jgi:hypothetical protein
MTPVSGKQTADAAAADVERSGPFAVYTSGRTASRSVSSPSTS